jgi:hypothetical protein
VRGANRQEELDEATASLLNVLAEFSVAILPARAVPLRESHPLAAIASELNALGATLQKQPTILPRLGHSLAAPDGRAERLRRPRLDSAPPVHGISSSSTYCG